MYGIVYISMDNNENVLTLQLSVSHAPCLDANIIVEAQQRNFYVSYGRTATKFNDD